MNIVYLLGSLLTVCIKLFCAYMLYKTHFSIIFFEPLSKINQIANTYHYLDIMMLIFTIITCLRFAIVFGIENYLSTAVLLKIFEKYYKLMFLLTIVNILSKISPFWDSYCQCFSLETQSYQHTT